VNEHTRSLGKLGEPHPPKKNIMTDAPIFNMVCPPEFDATNDHSRRTNFATKSWAVKQHNGIMQQADKHR